MRHINISGFRLVVLLCLWTMIGSRANAQELITSTPIRIVIPSQADHDIEILSSPTITRTATQTAIMLEPKTSAGEVNVRSEPDIEAERLGTIRNGEFYPVLGRYFRWLQFQYDLSPNGRAWVFDELVDIIGDVNAIPDLSVEPLPTTDPLAEAATQTQIAVTQTPGGVLTSTALSRVLPAPEQISTQPGIGLAEDPEVLPTFTYPADFAALAPTEDILIPTTNPETSPLNVPNSMPPIFPIILLGAGGLLGLVVSSFRR